MANQLRDGEKVRVAVLGVGALGIDHVRIYCELAAAKQAEFVGVYDVATDNVRRAAAKFRATVFASVAEAAAANSQ